VASNRQGTFPEKDGFHSKRWDDKKSRTRTEDEDFLVGVQVIADMGSREKVDRT
jgi:hypothetical protein